MDIKDLIMGKKILDELNDNAEKKVVKSRGAGRAGFLALKNEIDEALREGWAVVDVWRLLNKDGRVAVSYQAFNVYVNRYIRRTEKSIKERETPPVFKAANGQKSGFSYNPTPKSEEVL